MSLNLKDLDGDGQPGISWQFVALVLGGGLLIGGALCALLMTGTVTFDQLSGVIWTLVGAGAAGTGSVVQKAVRPGAPKADQASS
jgi:hypothetical protein